MCIFQAFMNYLGNNKNGSADIKMNLYETNSIRYVKNMQCPLQSHRVFKRQRPFIHLAYTVHNIAKLFEVAIIICII
jgi:hypothetical protein